VRIVRRRPGRFVGVACVAAGAALLVCAASAALRSLAWQQRQAERFTVEASGAGAPAIAAGEPCRVPPRRGEPLARLRAPRLGIDVVVAEGADPRTLSVSPGHLEGTALPGESDNCVIAGHRDGPFGRLRDVREGDRFELLHDRGRTVYRVSATAIVDKAHTCALAPSLNPVLTLVTCYPFRFAGKAPQRFVVRAVKIEDEPPAVAGDRKARPVAGVAGR
jgi:sortase A